MDDGNSVTLFAHVSPIDLGVSHSELMERTSSSAAAAAATAAHAHTRPFSEAEKLKTRTGTECEVFKSQVQQIATVSVVSAVNSNVFCVLIIQLNV